MNCIIAIMKKSITLLTMLLLIVSSQAQRGDLKAEIKQIIIHDTDISLSDTPGFIVGMVDGDSTYYVEFGAKIKGEPITLNTNDIFEVGSITKVYTSSLVSILDNEQILSITDPINRYISEENQNPRMDSVTILDLIHHSSGLPVRPYMFGRKQRNAQNPYQYYEKSDLLSFYKDFVPKSKGVFNYSHTNYALLEIVLENATGKSFAQLIDEYIVTPLELEKTFVSFQEQRKDIVAPGYDRAGRLTQPWLFASFGASEGLKTTVSDMVHFMRINLGIVDHPYSKIFESNHVKELNTNFNESIKTGRGWQILERKRKYDIVTHTGNTDGHNAFMAFVKETNTGVVILSNSNIGTRDLGFLILRMINYGWKREG